jgi:DNA-binding NarL/FixJ family response regulator
MSMILILLVDDNPQFLEAARHFLQKDPRLVITGSVESGENALKQVSQTRPDLVLLDLALPGLDGLEVTRRLKAQPNAPRVIILTLHDNAEYRRAAREAGADGFVGKSEFGDQLLPNIQRLFSNTTSSPDELAQGTRP